MIALLVMTDGREHIFDAIPSALESLTPEQMISERWIHDDSASPEFAARLAEAFPTFTVISTGRRSGFGGAIRNAWRTLAEQSRAPYIFHLEDDFTFNRPAPLDEMAAILEAFPNVLNMALRRQPWNDLEAAAGGIIEQHPAAYIECAQHVTGRPSLHWLEHRQFFTTNPGLYRRSLILEGWPDCPHSEGVFTHERLRDPLLHFGYFGERSSTPWVHHIGTHRAGIGY